MKKTKLLLPTIISSLVCLNPIFSLVSCNNTPTPDVPTDNEFEFDFLKDEYTNHVTPKPKNDIEIKDAIAYYLSDVKNDPKILLNDIFLTEQTAYSVVTQEIIGSFDEYYLKIKINDVNPSNKTISYTIVRKVSRNKSSDETYLFDYNLEFKNIPLTIDIRYAPWDDLIAHPCWTIEPSFLYFVSDLSSYFKSIYNWKINGSFELIEQGENFKVNFEDFDRDDLIRQGSLTNDQISAITYSFFYNAYSEYYSNLWPEVDYEFFNSPFYDDYLMTSFVPVDLTMLDAFCCSVDTLLLPDTEFGETSAIEIHLESEPFNGKNKSSKFVVDLVVNDYYIGEFSGGGIDLEEIIERGDKFKFIVHPDDYWPFGELLYMTFKLDHGG